MRLKYLVLGLTARLACRRGVGGGASLPLVGRLQRVGIWRRGP